MNVAVVGCLHGKLEFLYEELADWEKRSGKKVDFILCCGDFQVYSNLVKSHLIESERQR